MVGRMRVWVSRASSPERRSETSGFSSARELRREQTSGIIVTSSREILSMSGSFMTGNRGAGEVRGDIPGVGNKGDEGLNHFIFGGGGHDCKRLC